MARIPPVQQRGDLAPEHRAVHDAIAESRGQVEGPFALLLHSPEVAGRAAHLGAYIRFESTLDARLRELAIISVAREVECAYEWAAHVPLARQAGVEEGAIAAIARGLAPAGLSAEDAQIVEYARQLLRAHRVDESTFRAMRERLGVPGLVELTVTVGYYAMIACVLNAFEMAPAPGADLLP